MSTQTPGEQPGHYQPPTQQPNPAQAQPYSQAPHQTQPAPARSNAIAITVAVIGAVLLLGTAGAAATVGVLSLTRGDAAAQVLEVDTAGVTEIEIDSSAADFKLICAGDEGDQAFTEAKLTTSVGMQSWEMRVDDEKLRIEPKGNWLNSLTWVGAGSLQTVTLELPWALGCSAGSNAPDFDISIGAGLFTGFVGADEFELEVGAGEVNVEGWVRWVSADVSAGSATLDLFGVNEADFSVSAGSLKATLNEQSPLRTTIEVSAGELTLLVPNETFRISEDVSAGAIDNRLVNDSTSQRIIDVSVSAGRVNLRPLA